MLQTNHQHHNSHGIFFNLVLESSCLVSCGICKGDLRFDKERYMDVVIGAGEVSRVVSSTIQVDCLMEVKY